MMANADASGSVPWHLFDENTGTLFTNENYPTFWQDPRNYPNSYYWSPQPVNGWASYGTNGNLWAPDTAHMPDLNYVPYLITGNQYQLELLQAAANYADQPAEPVLSYYVPEHRPEEPGQRDIIWE